MNWMNTTVVAWLVLTLAGSSFAATPSQRLLPATTKGYLSVPDVYQLEASWNSTQLGQLLKDPVMNGFGEDLKRQLKDKFTRLNRQLGLTFDDLEDVPGGELAIARVRPTENESATVLLVDVTGHRKQADKLLAKIEANMKERNAESNVRELSGASITVYKLPKEEGEKHQREAVFYIKNDVLCAADNENVAIDVLSRFSGESKDNLESVEAYQAIMSRCGEAAGDLQPEVRWFVEPFGYIEAVRSARGAEHKRGRDLVKILKEQGFDAIQGIGGYFNFYVDKKYELMHRTLVYAPAVKDPINPGDKYNLAMRMLRLPNGGPLEPQDWIPRGLATYMSLNLDVKNAFESFGSLFDAIVGDGEGAWEQDVIGGIETDPHGPQINIREDLIAHLGQRITVMSDYVLPIDIKCERMLFGVEVKNVPALTETINRTMKDDPKAKKREFEGHVIWELVEEEEELQAFQFQGPGPLAPPPEEKRKMPNSAVCVAHGQLLIATHIEFLKKVLAEAADREKLAHSVDYRLIATELDNIAGDVQSVRFFSRTDEEYRPTYELLRQGKMPQAETLLAKILNRMLSDDDEEDIPREQLLDASKLPDFEMVRRYFGPAGLNIRSEENGWLITGFSLNKETP